MDTYERNVVNPNERPMTLARIHALEAKVQKLEDRRSKSGKTRPKK